MQNYVPRVILLDSETIINTSFLCGFLSFPEGNSSSINPATLYPAGKNDPPYLLYTENKEQTYDATVEALPPFTFTPKNPIPKFMDVMFQNSDGKNNSKIRVAATMGHPDTDLPELYVPRVFILTDMDSKGDGTGSVIYGFLMDIYEGDIIRWEASEWTNVQVSINSDNNNKGITITSILLFPINAVLPSFQLDLQPQGFGIKQISYEKAPNYKTEDESQ